MNSNNGKTGACWSINGSPTNAEVITAVSTSVVVEPKSGFPARRPDSGMSEAIGITSRSDRHKHLTP
jgi:hypothetical protein